jgi:putative transposase
VVWAQAAYRVGERRACRALVVDRSGARYAPQREPRTALRRRLHGLATTRLTFASRRLHTLLRREGSAINYKRVHRLYVKEGLPSQPRRRRRRKVGGKAVVLRHTSATVTRPNERWPMDFMRDVLADGRTVRVSTLADVLTRECVVLRAAAQFTGMDVVDVLRNAGAQRGQLPAVIHCDTGTEFTSVALDHWAYWHRVQLDFLRPDKPVDD